MFRDEVGRNFGDTFLGIFVRLVCELELCNELVYTVEEELRRAIDGVDELARMLLKIGKLITISKKKLCERGHIT